MRIIFYMPKGTNVARWWIYMRSCKQNRFNNAARLNNKEIRIHHNTMEEAEAVFPHVWDETGWLLHYRLIK